MNSKDLKVLISSVQVERDYLIMLLLEYINDNILIKEKWAVKSRKKSLWKLAKDLTITFNLVDFLIHELFKNIKEMNEKGFQILFSSYNEGIE